MNVRRGREYREKRREEANARIADRADITPQEQLERLDKRLGVGVGAARERARLAKQIKS